MATSPAPGCWSCLTVQLWCMRAAHSRWRRPSPTRMCPPSLSPLAAMDSSSSECQWMDRMQRWMLLCHCLVLWFVHVLLHLLLCTNSRLLLAGWGAHNVYICTYTYIHTQHTCTYVLLVWPGCCHPHTCRVTWLSRCSVWLRQSPSLCSSARTGTLRFQLQTGGIQWAFGGHSKLQLRSTPLDLKRLLAA